jgi:hypothetical protein
MINLNNLFWMKNLRLFTGFAFSCDTSGNILEVFNNSMSLDGLSSGITLLELLNSEDRFLRLINF